MFEGPASPLLLTKVMLLLGWVVWVELTAGLVGLVAFVTFVGPPSHQARCSCSSVSAPLSSYIRCESYAMGIPPKFWGCCLSLPALVFPGPGALYLVSGRGRGMSVIPVDHVHGSLVGKNGIQFSGCLSLSSSDFLKKTGHSLLQLEWSSVLHDTHLVERERHSSDL